ncbi:hypothetical protein CTI12_AA364550 [Artemisia annua]|uniref:Root cap n=1 Tax=Artemisia annua TaxID=35608 RepID=A0A2U1MMB4_ARTAN|nr:hypothetical protein CTI12_AA364550 [Artemisia annua]
MARLMVGCVTFLVVLMIVTFGEAATPPGITKNPSQASCKDKAYKQCYNLVHACICPKFCDNGCTVHCASCKPICINSTTPSPPELSPLPQYSPPPTGYPTPPTQLPPPPPRTFGSPPPCYSFSTNNPSARSEAIHNVMPPSMFVQLLVPTSVRLIVSHASRFVPLIFITSPATLTLEHMYGRLQFCDMPGAVCQDPRFIGADEITFYFHGKKDKDFCLVADSNLHINGHFIGKRNKNMGREFTWVQSIGTATRDDAIDRISITYDGESILLPETEGAKWQTSKTSITRTQDTNDVVVEVDNLFKITAKVVPITKEESSIHNYIWYYQ